MDEIYELKEKLIKELEEYGRKGELSTGSLEVVDKLAHTVKNLCKVIEDAEGEGYSSRSYDDGRTVPMTESSYRRGNRSYARGRRNVRRDSMGRYSSNGYSYADDMVDRLNELMDDAPENLKQDIQRLITKVDNM